MVVDATLGGGGHSREILRKIGEEGKLIAFDLDAESIKGFKAQISKFLPRRQAGKIQNSGNIFLIQENFSELDAMLKEIGINEVDAILADLGWSSDQLEGKGMSFQKNEPLDMRLDKKQELSAEKIVNEYAETEIGKIIREYGEEKFWRSIAKNIVKSRKIKRIESTVELARIIANSIPPKYRHGKLNPATKTFQAIRIAVNEELSNLKNFLAQSLSVLGEKSRLVVISFHSLEDRIVKNFFRENARGCICPKDFPKCNCGQAPKVMIITKKPVRVGEEEIIENPRSRSAKLRACEKI